MMDPGHGDLAPSFPLRPAGVRDGPSVSCHPQSLAHEYGKYSQFTDKESKAQNS